MSRNCLLCDSYLDDSNHCGTCSTINYNVQNMLLKSSEPYVSVSFKKRIDKDSTHFMWFFIYPHSKQVIHYVNRERISFKYISLDDLYSKYKVFSVFT